MPNFEFLASTVPEIRRGFQNSKIGSRDPLVTRFYRAAVCRAVLPIAKVSVRLSVRLSVTAWIVTKRKHLAKKISIMTNRKSPTSFPMSLRWTAYVAPNPPKGASKSTIFSFSVQKIGLSSKKVCYKVSLCKNFQRQCCNAFIGLSICAQMVGGRCPLASEIFDQSDQPPLKRRFPVYIRS